MTCMFQFQNLYEYLQEQDMKQKKYVQNLYA